MQNVCCCYINVDFLTLMLQLVLWYNLSSSVDLNFPFGIN